MELVAAFRSRIAWKHPRSYRVSPLVTARIWFVMWRSRSDVALNKQDKDCLSNCRSLFTSETY